MLHSCDHASSWSPPDFCIGSTTLIPHVRCCCPRWTVVVVGLWSAKPSQLLGNRVSWNLFGPMYHCDSVPSVGLTKHAVPCLRTWEIVVVSEDRFVSFRIVSYRIVSFRIVSFRFVSLLHHGENNPYFSKYLPRARWRADWLVCTVEAYPTSLPTTDHPVPQQRNRQQQMASWHLPRLLCSPRRLTTPSRSFRLVFLPFPCYSMLHTCTYMYM